MIDSRKPGLSPNWRWWGVALLFGVAFWLTLAAIGYPLVGSQEATLGDCIPPNATYTWRGELLSPYDVLELQNVVVRDGARADYAQGQWTTADGTPLDVRWRDLIRVSYGDGPPNTDAVVMWGDTARKGTAIIGLFLYPTNSSYDWHGKCVYLTNDISRVEKLTDGP